MWYRMAVVREITRSAPIFARLLMSASVSPSAKYSCSESWDSFSDGRTASDRICPGELLSSVIPIKR